MNNSTISRIQRNKPPLIMITGSTKHFISGIINAVYKMLFVNKG